MPVSEVEFERAVKIVTDAVDAILSLDVSPTKRAAFLTRASFVTTTAICRQVLESNATREELPDEDLQAITRIMCAALMAAEKERALMEALYSVGGVKQ